MHVGQTAFLGVLLGSSSGQGTGGGLGGGGANTSTVSGAQISSVVQNQAAANAGLVGGDVITSLNGQSVTSESSLSTIVEARAEGRPDGLDRLHGLLRAVAHHLGDHDLRSARLSEPLGTTAAAGTHDGCQPPPRIRVLQSLLAVATLPGRGGEVLVADE